MDKLPDLENVFTDMVKRDIPLSVILYETDYKLTPEKRELLHMIMIKNSKEIYTDRSHATYRVIHLPCETRLEYLTGKPSSSFPFIGDRIGVNTIDFSFEQHRKRNIEDYRYRIGTLYFRFKENWLVPVTPEISILKNYIEDGSSIIIGRTDGKPGFMKVSTNGCIFLSAEDTDPSKMRYSVVGVDGRRVILRYIP